MSDAWGPEWAELPGVGPDGAHAWRRDLRPCTGCGSRAFDVVRSDAGEVRVPCPACVTPTLRGRWEKVGSIRVDDATRGRTRP